MRTPGFRACGSAIQPASVPRWLRSSAGADVQAAADVGQVRPRRARSATPRIVWQFWQRCSRKAARPRAGSAAAGARAGGPGAPARRRIRPAPAPPRAAPCAHAGRRSIRRTGRGRRRVVGAQGQARHAARDHVALARQRRHPQAVDHVGRVQAQVDGAPDRDADLVGGGDLAPAGRVAVAHFPPPHPGGDGNRHGAARTLRRQPGAAPGAPAQQAVSTTTGKAMPAPAIHRPGRSGRAWRRRLSASSAITATKMRAPAPNSTQANCR
jgi:hypothetical protein